MIYAIISAMRQKIILSISNFYIQLNFYPTGGNLSERDLKIK